MLLCVFSRRRGDGGWVDARIRVRGGVRLWDENSEKKGWGVAVVAWFLGVVSWAGRMNVWVVWGGGGGTRCARGGLGLWGWGTWWI